MTRIPGITVRAFACMWHAIAAAVLLHCTDPAYVDEPVPALAPPVSGVQARLVGEIVRVQWQRPAGNFLWYRIYRTTATDSLGRPDSATLSTSSTYSHLDSSQTEFYDIPGLAASVYYYGITTLTMDGPDTVEGPLSPSWPYLAACTVGTAVRFTINHGSSMTASRRCTLSVEDPYRTCLSVEFTQISHAMQDRGGATLVPYPAPTYGPYALDSNNQVRDFARYGYPSSQSSGPAPTIVYIPVFDSTDALNPVTSYALGNRVSNQYLWQLPPRYGSRRIFARLTGRVAGGDTVVDTLTVTIAARVPQIRIELDPMAVLPGPGGTATSPPAYLRSVTTEEVRFRVVAGEDMCVPLCATFDVWLAACQKYATLGTSDYKNRGWYMTRPSRFSFTGVGTQYDSNAVYRISLDTADSGGRATFGSLLYGSDTTISGTRTASYAANRRSFDTLVLFSVDSYGAKEVLVAARFTDTVFAETLFTIGRATFSMAPYGVVSSSVLRDVCPPAIRMDQTPQNPDHLAAGAVVHGPFSFALAGVSAVDLGGALIAQTRLVLARKPDTLIWTSATPSGLTLDRIRPWLYGSFPVEIAVPSDTIRTIRWDDIDPSAWPYGDYIAGVVVATARGDSGFAHVTGNSQSNPWLISYQP